MKRHSIAVAIGLLWGSAIPGAAEDRFPGASWEHVSPEAVGWSGERLAQAEAWSRRIGSTAVMVIHHGVVVADWGDTSVKLPVESIRKSLVSALIGNAAERGEIKLTQSIGALGIDDNEPSLSAEEKTATVRDLLEARSGVYHVAMYETPQMKALRPPRYSHKPGTFWYYNNWDFNALGAIYEHAARSSIFDGFDREIAKPIGMQDYVPSDGNYGLGAASVYPAYPFSMSARDIARFALLYLCEGQWQDRQVVPAHWVVESTQPYSQSDFGPGYGYMWWTGFHDTSIAPSVTLPPGTYFAQGAGGQYAFVIPVYDLVVVHSTVLHDTSLFREFGRLLWLVLDAAHFPDIGPDASIEAAHGTHLDGPALKRLLPGKTLVVGEAGSTGPYRIRLNANGTATALRGREPVQYDSGSWRVQDDHFCRDWEKTTPPHLCLAVVADAEHIEFFGDNGLMFFRARLSDD